MELKFEQTITGKQKSQIKIILCNQPKIVTSVKVDNRLKSVYTINYPPHRMKQNFSLQTELVREIVKNNNVNFSAISFSKKTAMP